MTTERVGLVLSGGGARGAYHVGVIQYLAEKGISIDVISGASIGALNGAVIAAARDLKIAHTHLQTIWKSLGDKSLIKVNTTETINYIGQIARLIAGTSDIFSTVAHLKTLFSQNIGLVDESPIDELLDRYLDLKKLQDGLPLYVSVYPSKGSLTDFLTAIPALLNLTDTKHSEFLYIKSLDQTQQRLAILASAAIPLLFKARMIEINETDYFYSDGGEGGMRTVQGNTPITPLLELEKCTLVIVNHLCDGSLWDRRTFSNKFAHTNILEIRPGKLIERAGIAGDLIGFNHDNIQSWIDQGYKDTKRCLETVDNTLRLVKKSQQARDERDRTISQLRNDDFFID
jgi:NTE family protein